MTTLDELPRVVTGPGDYVTRKGQRVTIHTVSDGPETFRAKGAIWRMFRGKLTSRGYAIWHVSGRYDAVTERTRDIVGPWAPTP